MNTPQKHLCQSCHCLVEEDDKFCSNCGQKKITQTASLKEIIGDFWGQIFALDSKFLRTFIALYLIPGKLTKAYLSGQRHRYYSPVRLFLLSITVCFVLLNFLIKKSFETQDDIEQAIAVHMNSSIDSLKQNFRYSFKDSSDLSKIDSILDTFAQKEGTDDIDLFPLSFNTDNISISRQDVFIMSEEELIEKYKPDNFFKKLLLLQSAKAVKHPNGFGLYLLSHLSWIILFSIPLIALFIKLLYIRRKPNLYVEHLVHVLHLHTFALFLCSILWCWILYQPEDYDDITAILFTILAIFPYLFLSIKRVYNQSILKTSLKIFLFALVYPLIIVLGIVVLVVINFFAY